KSHCHCSRYRSGLGRPTQCVYAHLAKNLDPAVRHRRLVEKLTSFPQRFESVGPEASEAPLQRIAPAHRETLRPKLASVSLPGVEAMREEIRYALALGWV